MPSYDTHREARVQWRDLFGHAYRAATQGSTYSREEGILVIPVMGPDGTDPLTPRVHAPIGFRTAAFEYAKDNTPPLYPAQADTDSGDIILTSDLGFPAPRVNAGGWLTFGVSGSYTFVQPGGGRSTEDAFPIDKYPFVTPVDGLHLLPGPTGDGDTDTGWTWNRQEVTASRFETFAILG